MAQQQQRRQKAAASRASNPALFAELGVSGVRRYAGEVQEEWARELQGERGRRNLREMLDSDPMVGAILALIRWVAISADWRIDPAGTDPQEQEIADFVRGALFEDMAQTWADNLAEILSFLAYGWAVKELVYKRRVGPEADETGRSRFSDGRIGWRKWALRHQETLARWEFDADGGVQGMWQLPPLGTGGGLRFMPMEKLLLFRTEASRGPEGRSILRNAWLPYYRKKHLENMLGIGIERDLAGYPVVQVVQPDPARGIEPPDIFNANDPLAVSTLNELKRLVRSIRQDEQAGLVLPWWVTFQLVSASGRRHSELADILRRYDQMIALAVLADFLLIGHEQIGSKALLQTRVELFQRALRGLLGQITDVINRFAIPRLMELNAWPTAAAPRLVVGTLMTIDLETLGQYLSQLASSGMPLFGEASHALERALLQAAGLPTEQVDQEAAHAEAEALSSEDADRDEGA